MVEDFQEVLQNATFCSGWLAAYLLKMYGSQALPRPVAPVNVVWPAACSATSSSVTGESLLWRRFSSLSSPVRPYAPVILPMSLPPKPFLRCSSHSREPDSNSPVTTRPLRVSFVYSFHLPLARISSS